MRAWIVYSLLRGLTFAVPFAVLYVLLPDYWWVAAIGAAVIGFCLSYIFLRPQRDEVAAQLAAARAGSAKQDAEDLD